jgi:predicted aldo/keto reductase-like oxidoreductase
MRFPRSLAGIDLPKTGRLIARAVEGGVNYFDTAYIYGSSEEVLGTILEKNSLRDKVYIATKLPLVLSRSPQDFDKFFNKELERLRTTYIDYYLLHMLSNMDQWEKFRAWGIEDWAAQKKKEGKIRQFGFSFHGSQGEFLKLLEAYPWDFCQIQYNYTGENYQAGKTGLEKAGALGIPVIIMEPLLGGRLAQPPRGAEAIFKKAEKAKSPAEWALRWVWDHREATVVLSGMNDIKQLEENLRLADSAREGAITERERGIYKEALAVFNASYKVGCTGCNYCMPCPQHVNIPGCFAAYNTSFSLGWVQGMQQYATGAALTAGQTGSASNCVKCGKCEQHCPQHIPIIRSLEDVRKRMEPPPVRFALFIARTMMSNRKKREV